MTDAEIIRRVLRPRWADLPGNSFPEGSPYWGCKACLLVRAGGNPELFRAPPRATGWWTPEGSAWGRFSVGDDEDRNKLVAGWEALRVAERVGVLEVWDAAPGERSRSARTRADRYRVLLSNGTWGSGNLLRCFLDMVMWDELWVAPPRRMIVLVRSPTLVDGRRLIGAIGTVAALTRSPYPEWNRLWPVEGD